VRVLVQDHPYDKINGIEVTKPDNPQERSSIENFKIAIVKNCKLASRTNLQVTVPVSGLLDTGTDMTVVNEDHFWSLDNQVPFYRSTRSVFLGEAPYPLYDLIFLFPNGEDYSSTHGSIVAEKTDWEKDFGIADVWLGRDILNQLHVTFHGPNETFTIMDPARS
jgi:hypothetical protein